MSIKAAVFSDTHGNIEYALAAVRGYKPDLIIHLGDHAWDADDIHLEFPDIPMFRVRGNCDFATSAGDWEVVPLGPVNAFITHGHLYSVRYTTDSLVYAAQEQGCAIAMYGHTHIPDNSELGGVKILNPGTAGCGSYLTWADRYRKPQRHFLRAMT